jgi:hypothetical protein
MHLLSFSNILAAKQLTVAAQHLEVAAQNGITAP